MTHPITPPPELIEQWMQAHSTKYDLARHAAQWGANQELEACCEWLDYNCPSVGVHHLRATRRPKPPSLKEQALRVLVENGTNLDGRMELDSTDIKTIRRALEALPND
jgi:hypothetical protein